MRSATILSALFLVALGLGAFASLAPAAPTLDNLQTAYNGESNAQARYLAFAQNAQDEGYLRVAALFRAAAQAEGIHAKNHAAAIKKLGGVAKADVKTPDVKTTKENLQAAIDGETYEYQTMYAGFLTQARAEKNTAAVRTFNQAREAEKGHAKLYGTALASLDGWKQAGDFFVCPTCGNTVDQVTFKKCPVCYTKADKFEKVS